MSKPQQCGKEVVKDIILTFRSNCLGKVKDKKDEFGPAQLKEGCCPGLVLIVASLEANTLMLYALVIPACTEFE